MPYSITTYSGTPVATVQDATINSSSTSLTLIGRDYAGYGTFLNENFVYLLENFANDTEPENKITGQIWYDTSINTLKVWNTEINEWKPVGSVITQNVAPVGEVSTLGDLWLNTEFNQLYAYNNGWQLIGPPTASDTASGLLIETILDTSDIPHLILKFAIENQIIGIISSDLFTPKNSISGFNIITPGFNLVSKSSLDFSQFTGDASNADRLNGVRSDQFLRSDQNAFTPYQLAVGNLVVGSSFNLAQITTNNEVQFSSVTNGYNTNFYSNISGVLTRTLGLDGVTGLVTIDNSLKVMNNFQLEGSMSVQGTSTFVDTAIFQTQILPNADNTIDIGQSNNKFANVFATNFTGNLTGNVVANLITVGNVVIAPTVVTVFGNALVTQSFVTSYVQTVGKNSQGSKTISTSGPTGGSDGDIWYQV